MIITKFFQNYPSIWILLMFSLPNAQTSVTTTCVLLRAHELSTEKWSWSSKSSQAICKAKTNGPRRAMSIPDELEESVGPPRHGGVQGNTGTLPPLFQYRLMVNTEQKNPSRIK